MARHQNTMGSDFSKFMVDCLDSLSELDFKVAFARVEEMCEKLLANSIIENYYMEEL